MMRNVYLALGAREGAPETQIREGVARLWGSGLRPVAASGLWETEPIGLRPGRPVLNAALHAVTPLGPHETLEACFRAEEAAGRRRDPPEWRSLDVDILLFDDLILTTPDLTLPHPRFHLRRFNLAPLAEIAADLRHPILGSTIGELLRGCEDSAWARVLDPQWGASLVERVRTIR